MTNAKVIKVRITQVSGPRYWYSDNIGQVFTINEKITTFEDDTENYEVKNQPLYIDLRDCVVIEEGELLLSK
ncbi:MAG: hypothetical protein WC677_07725 [Clostridia bacterium]|jgi:hypothetical protein